MSATNAVVAFALLTMAIVTFDIIYTYAKRGFGFGFSSNRPQVEFSRFEVRMKRVLQNQVESAAYIIPTLAAVQLTGLTGANIELATLLVVVGRTAFTVLYYTGIPFIRIPAFSLTALSTLYLLVSIILDQIH